MLEVEFIPHPKYAGIEVSRCGVVRKNGRIAKQSTRPDGYAVVSVGGRGAPILRVHHLVLETFMGPKPDGMTARHLDGVPLNNAVSNLLWGTMAEQVADQKRHGTFSEPPHFGRPKGDEFTKNLNAAIKEYIVGGIGSRTVAAKHGVSKTHLLRKVCELSRKGQVGHVD